MKKNTATTIGIRLQDADGALLSAAVSGGTLPITRDGTVSGDIAHNASAATVQTVLRALSGEPQVTCSGGPFPETAVVVTDPDDQPHTYSGGAESLTGSDLAVAITATVTRPAVAGTTQQQTFVFSVQPSNGSYSVSDGTHIAESISAAADAATLLAALQAASFQVASVTGDNSAGFVVTFTYAAGSVPLLTVDASNLSIGEGGTVSADVTISRQYVAGVSQQTTIRIAPTVTAKLQKDGGTPTSATNAVQAAGAALSLSLTTTETNCDTLAVLVTATDAIPREYVYSPLSIPTAAAIVDEMDANSEMLANLDTTVSSRLASANYTAPPSASTIATAVGNLVVSGSYSLLSVLKYLFSFACGNLSGAGSGTETMKDGGGSDTRISATVDSDGNRTVTLH